MDNRPLDRDEVLIGKARRTQILKNYRTKQITVKARALEAKHNIADEWMSLLVGDPFAKQTARVLFRSYRAYAAASKAETNSGKKLPPMSSTLFGEWISVIIPKTRRYGAVCYDGLRIPDNLKPPTWVREWVDALILDPASRLPRWNTYLAYREFAVGKKDEDPAEIEIFAAAMKERGIVEETHDGKQFYVGIKIPPENVLDMLARKH